MEITEEDKRVLSQMARVHGSVELLGRWSRDDLLQQRTTPEIDIAIELSRKQTIGYLINQLEKYRGHDE